MRIEIIEPHGFCTGVRRAVDMAREALSHGKMYCLHEIVHNELVRGELEKLGMTFVEKVSEVPTHSTLMLSAHGVSPQVRREAEVRGCTILDATCPFVERAHREIRRNFAAGLRTEIIGNPDHAEVIGYLGEKGACRPDEVKSGERVGRVVQTTLDSEAYAGVCTATRDRQFAVREFAGDAVLVLGSANSSNTRRLAEMAEKSGKRTWRIGKPEDLTSIDFSGVRHLGITAGASTPESFIEVVVALLKSRQAEVA